MFLPSGVRVQRPLSILKPASPWPSACGTVSTSGGARPGATVAGRPFPARGRRVGRPPGRRG
eukprot:13243710-Alexandrium_andersonii.AAC.1